MEKKSLGRGLEHISEVFLSSENKEQNPNRPGSGKSDPNDARHPSPPKKGQIVSLDQREQRSHKGNKEKHVHAPYSDFFEEDDPGGLPGNFSIESGDFLADTDLLDAMCEVEEKIAVQKKISYPGSPDAQQKLIHLLCRHLKEGYSIRQIELTRSESNRKPGRCELKEETITINVEEPPPVAGM